MTRACTSHTGSVDRIYQELRAQLVAFDLLPESRLNESRLAQRLNASRTPIREALNRLLVDGFVTFKIGEGFSVRRLAYDDMREKLVVLQSLECELARSLMARKGVQNVRFLADIWPETGTGFYRFTPFGMQNILERHFTAMMLRDADNPTLSRFYHLMRDHTRFMRTILYQMTPHAIRDLHGAAISILTGSAAMEKYYTLPEAVITHAYTHLYAPRSSQDDQAMVW